MHSSSRSVRRARSRLISILISLIVVSIFLNIISYFKSQNAEQDSQPIQRFSNESQEFINALKLPVTTIKRTQRIARQIEDCPAIFGKITILVVYDPTAIENGLYQVANASLNCYLTQRNYSLVYIDISKDARSLAACGKYQELLFRKHCIAAEYLKDTDWMLVLDADTGVVNPHHCIEEWIDRRVNLVFYERVFNWEIASGNYLAQNTEFSRKFLLEWADWEFNLPASWHGSDNGVLQHVILRNLIPDAQQEYENCMFLWRNATNYDTYMAFVLCVKESLGATRLWPGKIRLFRRSHAWVRDGIVSSDYWAEKDFMIHGWKEGNITNESPFYKMPDPSKCNSNDDCWPWKLENMKSIEELKGMMADYEKFTAELFPSRIIQHLDLSDIAHCYPNCEKATNLL